MQLEKEFLFYIQDTLRMEEMNPKVQDHT